MPLTPLILLLPPFAFGICLGAYTGAGQPSFALLPWLLVFAVAAAAFFILEFLPRQQRTSSLPDCSSLFHAFILKQARLVPLFLAGTALLAAGVLHCHYSESRLKRNASGLEMLAFQGGKHVLTAQVVSAPIYDANRLRLIASAMWLHEYESRMRPLHGLLSITLPASSPEDYRTGDIIRFSAVLKPVRNFHTPGTFNYENWWALRGIRVKAFVPDSVLCVRTGHESSGEYLSWPGYLLENTRTRLMSLVREFFKGRPGGAVASALLFGNRAGLAPRIAEAFAITGTGHLLAVSGLHMALAAMLVFFTARWCLLRSERIALHVPVIKVATLLSMMAAVMYAGLAGFSPSATRAMIMILIFSLALLIERPHTPLNSLAAAAWILLAISPFYLFDMAFQLSFAAVFFLIIFSPLFSMPEHDLSFRRRASLYLFQVATISLVAALATAPLSAWYFQRMSIAGLALNIMLVPAVCFLILPLLIAGVFTSLLWTAFGHALFLAPAGFLIKGMLALLEKAASVPHAAFWIARPDKWQMALFWAALLAAGVSISRHMEQGNRIRLRMISAALLCAVAAGMVYEKYLMNTDTRFVLHLPDVGQGTCQVVEFPGGRLMVMDGGGFRRSSFDTGERIVGPYIRTLGYTHIDILALSHPETDHVGGLAALVRQFRPGELWTNSDRAPWNQSWRNLVESVGKYGIRHTVFHESREFEQYGIKFQVYAPAACPSAKSRNSRSLVIRLSRGGRAFLLTGDIDRKRETCLVAHNPLQSQVVVVPHHGSRTSSSPAFIRYVHARAAFISSGWRNYLGLPAPDIVEQWKHAGTQVFTTAHDGTVTASFSDHGLLIETWDGRHLEEAFPACPDI